MLSKLLCDAHCQSRLRVCACSRVWQCGLQSTVASCHAALRLMTETICVVAGPTTTHSTIPVALAQLAPRLIRVLTRPDLPTPMEEMAVSCLSQSTLPYGRSAVWTCNAMRVQPCRTQQTGLWQLSIHSLGLGLQRLQVACSRLFEVVAEQ